jgi:biopolymer transport protein ExbD
MASKRRLTNEINAGSMADIAFLLLIFFLVTTTISEDKGILVKLPTYTPEPPPIMDYHERNVFSVFINANNELLVRNQLSSVDKLKQDAKIFIINPNNDNKMAENPTKAVISLKNDRGTSYSAYIKIL